MINQVLEDYILNFPRFLNGLIADNSFISNLENWREIQIQSSKLTL